MRQDEVVFEQRRGNGAEHIGEVCELAVVGTGVLFDLVDVLVKLDECFGEFRHGLV